jgi:hypothetical protein
MTNKQFVTVSVAKELMAGGSLARGAGSEQVTEIEYSRVNVNR